MFKRFLSLLLVWSVLCASLIGYVLLPAYAQGERSGIFACNLPPPNYGSIRAVERREVFGLDRDNALTIWNMKGIKAFYSRSEWSHYFTASLIAEGVNGFKLRYGVYFSNLRDYPTQLYVAVYRIDQRGIIYDYPCITFVAERNYLENFLTYLRSN